MIQAIHLTNYNLDDSTDCALTSAHIFLDHDRQSMIKKMNGKTTTSTKDVLF
jgi:hypothetical protein